MGQRRRFRRLWGGRATASAVAVTFIAAVVTVTAGKPAATTAAEPGRPNIVVLMTDDQTLESIRVMSKVRSLIGDHGTTFTNSFVSYSLCCPSRATFLTGQYARNHRVLTNAEQFDGGYYRLDHANALPVWLQRAGYHTAMVGKYLNEYGTKDATEIPAGWSDWQGLVDPSTYRYFDYTINTNGRLQNYGADMASYQTDVLADRAVDVIRRRAGSQQPLFLWANFLAPHAGSPWEPGDPPTARVLTPVPAPRHKGVFAHEALPRPGSFDEFDTSDKPCPAGCRERLSEAEITDITTNYRQELESLLAVDEAVGAIVDALAETGMLANTYVMFTSDNGFFHGEHRLSYGKLWPYEPSIRVPLLMRGPGVAQGGRVGELVSNVDLPATILDIADGIAGLVMDGRSLVPLIAGSAGEWRPDFLLEYPNNFSGVRTRRYTYVEHRGGQRELYDLVADPDQRLNLQNDPDYQHVEDLLHERVQQLAVGPVVGRYAGADRYETAVKVSRASSPTGDVAFVASGEQFPDALAASAPAALGRGSVLLVGRGHIPRTVAEELTRLRPGRIVIAGGSRAVSTEIEVALREYAPIVERVAGEDRYATAAHLSASAYEPGVERVFVATGEAFPDSLAAGAAAGANEVGVLLVRRSSLPPATADELRRLRPRRIVVVGGTAAVSASVEEELASYAAEGVERMAGTDRYQTSVAVSRLAFPAEAAAVWLATGEQFADSVVAGAAAARDGGPLLLVRRGCMPPNVDAEIERLAVGTVAVAGGYRSVSWSTESRRRC